MTLDLFDQNPELKRMRIKALAYLAQADMAEKRLVKRLTRLKKLFPRSALYASYTAANAWKVVEALRQEALINEQRYAEKVFDNLKDKRDGWRAIRLKMLRRDIQPAVVDSIMQGRAANEQAQDLTKITAAAAAKLERLRVKAGSDIKKKSQIKFKLYSWLAMRGYGSEEIRNITGRVNK